MSARRPSRPASGAASTAAAAPVRARVTAISARRAEGPLGPGAHFAKLFRKLADDRFEATLFDGARIEVRVAPEVDLALADRCLAEDAVVLIGAVGREALLFGALRTRDQTAEEVVIEAPKKLVLRSGKSRIELRADGRVKLTADQVTVDAPREVRLASSRVEIP